MKSTRLPGDAMKELVEGGRLKRVDVLLTRSKRSLLGWLIRFGTKSYWNHAAMVYLIQNKEDGYHNTFIIESGGAGIDIHNIGCYFKAPKRCDVGIKRLNMEWFQSGKVDYPRKVRGLALQEIDDKYDYRMILSIARRILRQLILGFMFPILRFQPTERRRARQPKVAKIFNVNAYICSGFVQWSYYTAVASALEGDHSGNAKLEDVLFNEALRTESVDEDLLLSTTPADIASCKELSWKYIIKDGVVWDVASEEDVEAILRSK